MEVSSQLQAMASLPQGKLAPDNGCIEDFVGSKTDGSL